MLTRAFAFTAAAVSLLVILAPRPLVAQVDRGGIVGVVNDPSGARVPGAEVTITNLATNQSVKLLTDQSGSYAANLLRIGTYSVMAEMPGFQKVVEPNIPVGVNQVVRVDLTLRLGGVSETIEVNMATPMMQAETSSLGTIETERRISELPLNGRNFIQLAYLGPGANGGQTGSNVSGGVFENERANEAVSVNGLRVTNNNFLLNGVDNNEFGLGGVIVLPPPDAIQEFRTEENSMSAEFGRGGAAVNVVLKSGTNQLHGGAFEFFRNQALDAKNYFDTERTPFQRNQYGAFMGGPLIKDRMFLFGDYQGSRLRENSPFISTIPTMVQRTGDFSGILGPQIVDSSNQPVVDALGRPIYANEIYNPYTTRTVEGGGIVRDGFGFDPVTGLPIPGQANIIPPGLINGVGQNVANLYPQPTSEDLFNNYQASQERTNDQDSFDLRLDYLFHKTDQIFGAYSFGDIRSVRPGPLGDLGGSDCCPSVSDSRAQHLSLGYTHTFSPKVMNDLHGGYFRYAVNALPFNYGKNLSEQLGIPYANRGDENSSGLINIDTAGLTPVGDSMWLPEHAFENVFQLADTLTWVHGRHSFKFGIDFRRQQRNFFQLATPRGNYIFDGLYTSDLSTGNGGSGLADLLLGISLAAHQDYLQGLYPTRYWDLAEFVQDDVRVRSNLTLNLGFRYQVASPANGRVGNFDLTRAVMVTSYGSDAVSHAGVEFDKHNFAPRIGAAWSLRPNTVVRGAFGIFYSAEANIFDDLGLNPPQDNFYDASYNAAAPPTPSQFVSYGFPASFPEYDPNNLYGAVKTTGPKRLMPRIYEWNLTVQHQFGRDWVAQIGYVGTKATRLWNHESSDLNQPLQPLDTNFCGPDPNNCIGNYGRPFFDRQPNLVNVLPLDYAQLDTFYNAFQASVNKRLSYGFNMLAAYTFGKNLGNADGNVGAQLQDSHHPEAEYGPSAPDLRHRFSVSYLYELPVGRGRHFMSNSNAVANALLGGWQVAGITAVQSGEALTAVLSADYTNAGSPSPRPNQIHDPYDFSFMSDPTAFTDVYGCTPGVQTLQCWYNPEAFVVPDLAPGQSSAHQFGNSHIGNLRGPMLVNFDFVVQKNFKIHEEHQLQFRAEFFNLFNHPNFGLPGSEVDVPGGNSITSTATSSRQLEFALKYTF